MSAAFSLWRILSRTSHRTGPRCAPSIPLVAHGFTTTQPPLARRLARFARMRFAPHFVEPPYGAYSCAPACSATSSDPPESSSPAYSHSRSAVRQVVCSTAFQPAFEAHPARPALSTDHSADSAWLPASPVTLPTVPQPAQTAPPVVESLSFLHRAPSPDACRVLARRTGRPQRPAAVGRAGPFRFRKEQFVT